ncbi:MAG TPA: BamA/TamA family outer membrane protein [candidate division Zixibacteria bacterium]|jgi:hypothetical protein
MNRSGLAFLCCLRITLSIGVLSLTVWPVPSSAQEPDRLGTLVAETERFVWITAQGDSITGRHDHMGILPSDRQLLSSVFTGAGLVSDGSVLAPENLAVEVSIAGQQMVRVSFSRAAGHGYPMPLRWSTVGDARIDAAEFWAGSVFSFNGPVMIAGEVAGNVIAIGGDITLREGSVVRGAVVVVGGILRQRGDAKVYGGVFAPAGHRRPRLSISRAWEFEDEGFSWRPDLAYDRVDGFRPGASVRWRSTPFAPQFEVFGAYAFTSETWQYRFEMRQRLMRTADIEARLAIFRQTQPDEQPWIPGAENSIFALVAGSDYRDYMGVDGGEVAVTYKYRERGVLSAAYRNTDYRRLDADPDLWHLFRPDHDFRANFSTLDSALLDTARIERNTSALLLSLRVDPREQMRDFVGFNGSLELVYEIAGGGLGGDFDYDRITFRGRGWWDTGRWHRISLFAFYGNSRRDLPPNKHFFLGGVGTLRGYSGRAYPGTEALFATFEYRFSYWENDVFDGAIIFFSDLGNATFADDLWDLSDFKSDIGLGLGLGRAIRVDIAKGLDRSDRDLRVTVRLASSL